jgi:bacillopeptidase F
MGLFRRSGSKPPRRGLPGRSEGYTPPYRVDSASQRSTSASRGVGGTIATALSTFITLFVIAGAIGLAAIALPFITSIGGSSSPTPPIASLEPGRPTLTEPNESITAAATITINGTLPQDLLEKSDAIIRIIITREDGSEITGAEITMPKTAGFDVAKIPLSAGSNIIEAVVVVGGVEGTRSAPITVIRDTTAPALTVTAPTPGEIMNGDSVTVTGKTDKDIDVQVRNETTGTIEGGRSTTKGAFSIGTTLRDGTNVLTITATDGAGNQTSKSVEISTSASVGRISIVLNPGTIILSKKPIEFRITATATDSTGAPASNVRVCMYVTADGATPSQPACVTSDVNGRAAWTYAFPNNFNTEGRGLVTVTYELSVGDPISGTQSFRVYLVKP